MPSLTELGNDTFFLAVKAVKEKCERALTIYALRDQGFSIGGVALLANVSIEQAALLQAEVEAIITELPTLIAAIPVNKLNQSFSSIGSPVGGGIGAEPIVGEGV